MFRDDFVWGVSSSAYQIEGTDPEDGRGKNIWDDMPAMGKIQEGRNALTACDHMHRYAEDFRMLKHLNIKAYRFSVSWPRIMPEGTGRVNEKAITMYRDMIIEMKKNGVVPYLTMYHWDLPQALEDQGGWLNENVIEWFGEYAKVVAENFTDICDYFITLNEPQCFVGLGYDRGVHAPGKELSTKEVFQIAHNALRAHGKAVINLRKYAKKEIQIGYAPTCSVAIPASEKPEDIEAAKKVYFGFYQQLSNWSWNVSWFSDPVFLGKYPEEGLEKFAEYLPKITEEDMKLIHQPLDFMGQNIYNGYYISAGKDGEPVWDATPDGLPITASKWPNTPECLYWAVRFVYERYGLPIYITENGVSCADNVAIDGRIHDNERIEFLDQYLSALQKAADEGADVRGYFQWTFLDNFEWEKGYSERFGMIWVDFATQQRIAKDSAFWFQKTAECNGANLSINQKPRQILHLKPRFVERIWGGNRLKTEWGYDTGMEDHIGECWAVSADPDVDSEVASGVYKGKTLSQLWKEAPELFGNLNTEKFPLLVKLIDARENLSLQVHPGDSYAKEHENSSGKKECWYILDCPENAAIIMGNKAKDRADLEEKILNAKWEELINEVPVRRGDCVQIDPGTLHAIKGGFLLIETQQNSDVTYRIYDYDRLIEGMPRELHIRQGIDVLTTPNIFSEKDVIHLEEKDDELQQLVANNRYIVWKLKVTKPTLIDNSHPFLIMSVIEGDGLANGVMVKKGAHFIVPNGLPECRLQGDMTLIISAPVLSIL